MSEIAFFLNCNIPQWKSVSNHIEKIFKDVPHKIFLSEYAGHLPIQVGNAIRDGYHQLIVAGGDGSINELINGWKKHISTTETSNHSNFRFGVIPMGTGNDFCKSLKSIPNLEDLKNKILQDQVQLIDVGEAHFYNENKQPITRYFVNITDVGMGGVVVENLAKSKSMFSKSTQYQMQILKTFFTYKKSSVIVQKNNEVLYQGDAMNVVVANGKYFGSGLGIAPEAKLDDGLMDIVVLGNINTADYLLNLGKVKKCKKVDHPQVLYYKSDVIEIQSTDHRQMAIDMDGEFVGYAPLKIINLSQHLYFYS